MAARTKQSVMVGGREVTLTNLQKVLFPEAGFTKAQVIDYYVRVADYLLPHIEKRPVTLKRYPEGVRGAHFYEKNAPRYTPEWVARFAVPRRSGGEDDINYVLLNDLPSLVWAANTANLEVHPFLCRVPDIQRPTSLVFDLDPGEGVDLLACAEVAKLLRDVFEHAGVDSFVKVSGSKGLQMYVPLNSRVTYDDTQPFARELADRIASEHPKLAVSQMAKALRKGKVFIDWSQNSDFKTTVAVYSMRAKRERPYCSMPVTWEELERALKKRDASGLQWEPEAALQRLEKIGDQFAPVLRLRQKLPKTTAAKKRPRTRGAA